MPGWVFPGLCATDCRRSDGVRAFRRRPGISAQPGEAIFAAVSCRRRVCRLKPPTARCYQAFTYSPGTSPAPLSGRLHLRGLCRVLIATELLAKLFETTLGPTVWHTPAGLALALLTLLGLRYAPVVLAPACFHRLSSIRNRRGGCRCCYRC